MQSGKFIGRLLGSLKKNSLSLIGNVKYKVSGNPVKNKREKSRRNFSCKETRKR